MDIAKAVARIYLSRRLADNNVAVSTVDLATRLEPDDGEAAMLLGASQLLRGDVDAALAALDDAVTVIRTLAKRTSGAPGARRELARLEKPRQPAHTRRGPGLASRGRVTTAGLTAHPRAPAR